MSGNMYASHTRAESIVKLCVWVKEFSKDGPQLEQRFPDEPLTESKMQNVCMCVCTYIFFSE